MNGNGEDNPAERRLTRLEDFMEAMAAEQQRLLTAQVVLTDRMDKLTDRFDRFIQHTDENFRKLTEAQAATDERIGILVRMMDDWIRRQP